MVLSGMMLELINSHPVFVFCGIPILLWLFFLPIFNIRNIMLIKRIFPSKYNRYLRLQFSFTGKICRQKLVRMPRHSGYGIILKTNNKIFPEIEIDTTFIPVTVNFDVYDDYIVASYCGSAVVISKNSNNYELKNHIINLYSPNRKLCMSVKLLAKIDEFKEVSKILNGDSKIC